MCPQAVKLPNQRILTHPGAAFQRLFAKQIQQIQQNKKCRRETVFFFCAEMEENMEIMENTKKMDGTVEQAGCVGGMSIDEKLDLILHGLWEMKAEIGELKTEVGKLRTDVDELRADVDELKTEVGKLRTEVDGLRADVDELKTEVGKLRTEVDELRADVDELKTEVGKLRTEVDELKAEFRELQSEVGELNIRVSALEGEINRIKVESQSMKIEIQDLKQRVINIELIIENEIRVHIMRIAEGHMGLKENLDEARKPSKEMEKLTLRVGVLESDVRILKEKFA